MPTNHNRIRTLAITLTVMLLLLSTGYIVLIKIIDLDTYKEQILAELQKNFNRPVTYQSGDITFDLGPAISLRGISVKEPDNSTDFVSIENLTFKLDLLPLLRKQLVIHGLVADRALIRLERHRDGSFNISDLLKSSDSESDTLKINQIKLKKSNLTFTDSYLQQDTVITVFGNSDLFLEKFSRGSKGSFKFSTHLGGGANGTVAINGKIKLSPKDTPLQNSTVNVKISAKGIEASHFWPYYRQFVPFKKIVGAINADTEFHGRLNEFSSSGKISVHSLKFDYQPIFKQVLAAKAIQLKYSMELNKTDISIKAIEIAIDGADIKGSCAIKDYSSKDPRITAQAVTSRLEHAKYKQYIPYGIIVKDTSEWIEQHLTGGTYQLEEGRLDGKVSQILHMESGENYNILYIKARGEKGIVSYGNAVPTFNNIKGTLELKGKDFFLHNMSGNFGVSPMTLEGKITDYPLDRPSGYPFRMTISPGKSEVAWLLGKNRAGRLSYNGNSSLTLVGEGFTSGYHLSGDWNLTPAAYSYSNFISKPVGTTSSMKFKGTINPKEAVISSLSYTLAGLAIDLAARYPFDTTKDVELLLNSNLFSVDNIAPMSPYINRYQPSGRIQLSLRGALAASAEDFRWRGTVTLNNASLRYSQTEKPISALTGTISFDEAAMETSQLTARIGNTTFTGKGTINTLEPLSFNTTFSSQKIDLADFGLKLAQKPLLITKVKGDISCKENSLAIKTLSGNLNNSQLSIRGTVSDIEKMKAELAISSAYMDISDLVLLGGIEKVAIKPSRPSPNPTLKLAIKADKGAISGLGFEKLNATVNLANKSVQIRPLEADILGGKLVAKGTIESQSTPTRYQVDFKLANVSADELTAYLTGNKREVTGVMSLEGNLSARGETADLMKKTTAGDIKIHANKGTLRHFSGLSKVFSILNVSQLFKFKLPDMVSEGMPYSEINGTFAIKDGFVRTNDLFLTSNAMNLSLVGKHDFVNDNLDFTLGIQPLQTVDKVVSHIPIVGWILTGEDKSLISTYFEIKGKSSAPKVSAIPVSSLGKGVLGIFKRLFQLPAKLVTDTGEVILGN